MSGHKSRRNNLTTRTPDAQAISRLDQLAAAVADARQQPNMVALAGMEEGFLNAYLQGSPFGGALDPLTVGAAWMIIGNLFASHINTMPEDQRSGPAQLANLARLAGQRLYTGDRLPVTLACPYTHATGAPCTTTRTGSTQEQADKLMGAHVWQNHPDKTWPPAESPSEITCSCGHPGCHDSANGGGDDCKDCTFYTSMLVGEDGNLRSCPGAGREPKTDGEVRG